MDFSNGGSPTTRTFTFQDGIQLASSELPNVTFNWRGRTVDTSGNGTNPESVQIGNSYGSTTVSITNAGQTAIDLAPVATPVSNQDTSVPAMRETTRVTPYP